MTFHRQLCLTVLCPDLDKLSSCNDAPALIEKYYHEGVDHGAGYFFHRTKPDVTIGDPGS